MSSSSSLQDDIKGSIVIFELVVSVLAVLLNAGILVAVARARITLSGYKHFLISLTFADLFSSVVNIVKHSVQMAASMLSAHCWLKLCRSLQFVSFTANLLNICGMSVDHFVGILYPLNYHRIMNKKTLRLSIVGLWCLSIFVGFADVPISLVRNQVALRQGGEGLLDGGLNDTNCLPGSINASTGLPSAFHDLFDDLVDFVKENNVGNQTGQISDEFLLKMMLSQEINPDVIRKTARTTTSPSNNKQTAVKTINSKGKSRKNVQPSRKKKIERRSTVESEVMTGCAMERKIAAVLKQAEQNRQPTCIFASNSSNAWVEISVMALAVVCFLILAICYGKIFAEVLCSKKGHEGNIRKLVMTTVLLLGAFTICWMPFMCYEVVMLVAVQNGLNLWHSHSISLLIVHNVFNSMLMSYPLIDPIIYAARLAVIRRSIVELVRKMFCIEALCPKQAQLPCDKEPDSALNSRRLTYGTAYGTASAPLPGEFERLTRIDEDEKTAFD